ncbi:enoyl-(Acyl carrier protein) reductase domain-containing protein [Phthorimaea operculella]|nr:enoyl-(Acyl carrier protein) reductase domain-containing protein [Phthorimaea operculella]
MSLLKNKVALVTGASSGIGAAIAEKFAEEGAKVAMVGRNQTKLANIAQQVEKKGAKPLVIVGDVTNEDDCRRMLAETLKHFGKLDILVNNAGIGGSGTITDENAMQKFDQVMNTNLRSAVFMTHIAAPHLIETKGNIINMSSISGKATFQSISFTYAVSKAALDHFTRCSALDLSTKGVRVNAINPGPVKSDIIANAGITEPAAISAIQDRMRSSTALDRIAEAEEVADLAVFLASDKARSITGSTYLTDNGVLIKSGAAAQ